MSKLKGKVALITGASSGIGAATAIMLSKHGATLAISGRNVDNLNKTAGLCQVEEGQQYPLIIQGTYTVHYLSETPVICHAHHVYFSDFKLSS